MAWPKGVPRKKETVVFVPPASVSSAIHYDAIFGIRSLRTGQFKGLWELVQLNNEFKRTKIITDANARGMIIRLVNQHIMKIVVGQ